MPYNERLFVQSLYGYASKKEARRQMRGLFRAKKREMGERQTGHHVVCLICAVCHSHSTALDLLCDRIRNSFAVWYGEGCLISQR